MPSVTALAGGGYVVGWEDFSADSLVEINNRVFGPNGMANTSVAATHAKAADQQQAPDVTATGGWRVHDRLDRLAQSGAVGFTHPA